MTTYADLVESVKGRICVRCRTTPRVAWLPTGELSPGGALPTHAYRLRCECQTQAPSMVKDSTKMFIQERTAEMIQNQDPQLRGRELPVLADDLGPTKPMTIAEFDERQALLKHVSSFIVLECHRDRLTQANLSRQAGGSHMRDLWQAMRQKRLFFH